MFGTRVLLLVVLSGLALPPAGYAADDPQPVYTDGLAPGWANWSWATTLNFAAPTPAHGGSGVSLAVTHTGAWGGLFLHNDSAVSTAEFADVRFWIHGGAAGGQALQFFAVDASGTWSAAVPLAPPAAGVWAGVVVALTDLGLATVGGLVWQDASGGAQPPYYLDDIAFLPGEPQPPVNGPALSLDATADRHLISPFIYGMNFADATLAAELDLPVNRFGGNSTTRYNWQNDTSNRAMDWFFENIPNDNAQPGSLPDGSASDQFVDANRLTGTESLLTLPLIGWSPKARGYACGFSVAKYGAQQEVDPWRPDCGNGVHPDGTPLTGNDPTDTSVAIGPAFVQSWLQHLVGRYGAAAQGGVRFYCLDNEPMLWNSTHRDVHPDPVGYDELRDRTWDYAAAVKAADPGARTLGPVLWGWTAYFYSALDVAAGGDWWNTRPDRRAHGDLPFVDWYLQQMQAYATAHGVRILDYLDLHYYPQADVALQPAGDAATQARRLRSTRSLWDPTYVDESWIGEAVRLIPRMRDWVSTRYPGTRLAVTEYNWGGLEAINGALAQADVLGIFGRERLDLATLWGPPEPQEPGAFAFRIYRNFDGAGARFGSVSVRAASADQSVVSTYAALGPDGRLTAVLINKTGQAQTCPLTVTHGTVLGPAAVYRYSGADLLQLVADGTVPFVSGAAEVVLPANSIALLAVPTDVVMGDADGDADADLADFAFLQRCLGQSPAGPCASSDWSRDGQIDAVDFEMLRANLTGPP